MLPWGEDDPAFDLASEGKKERKSEREYCAVYHRTARGKRYAQSPSSSGKGGKKGRM